jgi:2-polyprenyl-3-methyl-5-hydroxy-6-metoxy-1,4-benzoquinol methylase
VITQLGKFAEKAGSQLDPLEFYHHVQLTFHDVESEYYDRLHEDMYVYLVDIFARLFSIITSGSNGLRILDIGAGTGLVETFIAQKYSCHVQRIDIIEPNALMIRKLEAKNREWNLPVYCLNSYLEEADIVDQYDVAICSSVLHHIPNLSKFISILHNLVKPSGFILTMQDPRNEACSDTIAAQRRLLYDQHEASSKVRQHFVKRFVRKAFNLVGVEEFVLRRNPVAIAVNKTLKKNKVIKNNLTMAEIWAITDIHVPGQPGGMGEGISLQQLKNCLPAYEEIDYITYNFFNQNYLNLPDSFKEIEKQLLMENDSHGFLFASLFRRQN